jgi:hypothetical protein
MARVTTEEVKEIISTDLEDIIIDVYITGANQIVSSKLANSGLSTATLKEIERWLTAHMIANTKNRMTVKEKLGEASIEYIVGKYGSGLSSTPYGQTVLLLDTSGILGSSGKRAASITAIRSFD